MYKGIKIDRVIDHKYHRNGICGAGFFAVDFIWSDGDFKNQKARAIIFPNGDDKPEYYSITSEDISDRWRGDHFIDDLWTFIEAERETKAAYA